jgi:hypothetical protein
MVEPRYPTGPSPDPFNTGGLALPGVAPTVIWLAPPSGDGMSPQLARTLLDTHTRRGDVVVDVDDDIALAAAAAETQRRHHALGGAQRLADLGDAAGYVDLVLLSWPRPQPANPRWLLVACRALLRTDSGALAVAVRVPARQRLAHLSALTGAARAAGLRDAAHVLVFDPATFATAQPGNADPAGDTPAIPEAIPAALPVAQNPGGHTRPDAPCDVDVAAPHTDLLIFTVGDDPHE